MSAGLQNAVNFLKYVMSRIQVFKNVEHRNRMYPRSGKPKFKQLG